MDNYSFCCHNDHLGQRMARMNGSAATLYLYDIFGNLIEEADMDLNPINTYIYLGNHRVAVVGAAYTGSFGCSIGHVKESAKANWAIIILVPLLVFLGLRYRRNRYVVGVLVIIGGGAILLIMTQKAQSTLTYDESMYYYHNDHLGTPQVMTGPDAAVVWDAVYEPFGKINTYAVQTFTNNFRFPGQYEDTETGMYYNWNRYYIPEVGRYNRFDPIFVESNLIEINNPFAFCNNYNLYSYTPNNPIMFIDLNGLCTCTGLNNTAKELRKVLKSINDNKFNQQYGSAKAVASTKCFFGFSYTPGLNAEGPETADDCGCLIAHEFVHRQQCRSAGGFYDARSVLEKPAYISQLGCVKNKAAQHCPKCEGWESW